jgi:ribosome maturation factor RimP
MDGKTLARQVRRGYNPHFPGNCVGGSSSPFFLRSSRHKSSSEAFELQRARLGPVQGHCRCNKRTNGILVEGRIRHRATITFQGATAMHAAIERTVTGLGYDLVDVERRRAGCCASPSTGCRAAYGSRRGDGEFVTVDDCEIGHAAAAVRAGGRGVDYARLEVSSPGLDRPLKTEHYQRFAGQQVEHHAEAAVPGRKKFKGVLGRNVRRRRLVLDDKPLRRTPRGQGGQAADAGARFRSTKCARHASCRWSTSRVARRRQGDQAGKRGTAAAQDGGQDSMNREMLMLVDAISREKSVERDVVFGAVEAALAQATKKLHGGEVDIRVAVDRDTGNYETFRRWLVVPDEAGLQNPTPKILLSMRKDRIADIEVGDYIEEPVESVPIGRIGARRPSRSSCRRSATPSASSCSTTSCRAATRSSSAPSSAWTRATSSSRAVASKGA